MDTYFTTIMNKNNITLVMCEPRKTWRGLWTFKQGKHTVYVSNNLPMEQFLLTLAHEIAHALTYDKYDFSKIKPHGPEWKQTFQEVMKPVLNGFLPSHIEEPIKQYMLKPTASSARCAFIKGKTVESVPLSDTFKLKNDTRVFKKIKKYRINWSCVDVNTGKSYRVRGDVEIF
jgi:SprT protein